MKLKVIDLLSNTGIFQQSEKYQTPLECKFVLISSDTTYYLLFGALHVYNYHAQLLERFCLDNNLDYNWKKEPDQLLFLDSKYVMKGGGWFRFDFSVKILSIIGMSTAYGRFDEFILAEFTKKGLIYPDFQINLIR